jgi:hypothetical protein
MGPTCLSPLELFERLTGHVSFKLSAISQLPNKIASNMHRQLH